MVKGAAVAAPVADVVKAPVAGVDVIAPVAGVVKAPVAGVVKAPVAGVVKTPDAGAAVTLPVAGAAVTLPVAGAAVTLPVAGAAVTPLAVLGEAPVAVDNAPPAAGVSDLVVLVASSNIVGPVAVGNAPVAAVVDVPPARVNVLSAPEAFPDAKLFVTGIAANAASYFFFDSNILFLAPSS